MAWETRGNNTYYYKKERRGNRVVSTYYGKGEFADLIASFDEIEQRKTEIERQKELEIKEKLDEKSLEIEQIHQKNAELVEIVLRLLGFHKYKGQWRKKRNAKLTCHK